MRRLILLACLLALTSGCGKSAKTENKAGGGGAAESGGRPAISEKAGPLDVIKNYLSGPPFVNAQVVSSEGEKSVTLNKKPAVALRVKWKEGDGDEKDQIFLIQDQQVKEHINYEMSKSMDENIAAAVQKQESA